MGFAGGNSGEALFLFCGCAFVQTCHFELAVSARSDGALLMAHELTALRKFFQKVVAIDDSMLIF